MPVQKDRPDASDRPAPRPAPSVTDVAHGPADTLIVEGLVVSAFIGVEPDERLARQRLRIDVRIETVADYRARVSADTYLSYADVVTFVRAKAASDVHVPLVEDWAEAVADHVLTHPLARRVTVTVLKLDIFPDADGVGIRITRDRAT